MSRTTEHILGRIEAKYSTKVTEQVKAVYGEDFAVGADIARRFHHQAKRHELAEFRPPIFAVLPEHDNGESTAFKCFLGVPPEEELWKVASVIKSRYGYDIEFVGVEHAEDLLPAEQFMIGRLPAVRLCLAPVQTQA